MAAYVEHLLAVASGRTVQPTLLIKAAYAMTALVAEPVVHFRYPYRYEGERFVMWSDSPERNDEQMAAMDAHIRGLERLLGRRSDYKSIGSGAHSRDRATLRIWVVAWQRLENAVRRA